MEKKDVQQEMQPKEKPWLLFIPSGLVLFIYPAVLIANIMSMAAESGDVPEVVILMVQAFLWISTLYPLTYFAAIIFYRKGKDNEEKKAIAKWPYYHLALAVAFFLFWAALGN